MNNNTYAAEERFSCPISGCNKDFARPADMRRHVKEAHGDTIRCQYCDWRGAKREDRLKDHLRKAHSDYYDGIHVQKL